MLEKIVKLVLIALGIILLAMLVVAIIMAGPKVALPMAIPPMIGAGVVGLFLMIFGANVRSRRAWTILNGIEQAVRLNMPLPQAVRAIGESEGRRIARQFRLASRALEHGAPVAVVLEQIPSMPARIVSLVEGAEHAGRLPQVLAQLVERRRRAVTSWMHRSYFVRIYPLVLGITMLGISSMILVFVMPKFQTILRDFNTRPPAAMQLLLWAAHDGIGWMFLAGILLSAILVFAIGSAWRAGLAGGLIETPGNWLADRLPWIGRMSMHRELGNALSFVADAIDSGQPLTHSLEEAARMTTSSRLRHQLLRWSNELLIGQSIVEAARSAGLPRLVCGMLATGAPTSDLAPVLRFLGRYYLMRFSRLATLLEAAVLPIVALIAGCFVTFLAASVLVPLVTLIQTVSVPVRL